MEDTEAIYIKVNPKLKRDLTTYTKLIKSSNSNLIRELIKKELQGKILTNEYITLAKPLYFNWSDFTYAGKITATKIKPSIYLTTMFKVLKIPNNLDTYNKEFKTYCYDDNINLHRGMFIYRDIYKQGKEIKAKSNYLFFEYDTSTNNLGIHLLNLEDMPKNRVWLNKENIKFNMELKKLNGYTGLFNLKKELNKVICLFNDCLFFKDDKFKDNDKIIFDNLHDYPITSSYERLTEDTKKALKENEKFKSAVIELEKERVKTIKKHKKIIKDTDTKLKEINKESIVNDDDFKELLEDIK